MKIDDVIDTLAHFDPIDRIEGAVFVFKNAPWRKAYRRHGVPGIVSEFMRCVFSRNVVEHELKRGSISGADMEAMLRRHGVKLGDRGFGRDDQHLSFVTKKRQARWAEYLMERYGVDVTSTFDSQNRRRGRLARERRGREMQSAQVSFGASLRKVVHDLIWTALIPLILFLLGTWLLVEVLLK